MLLITLGYFNFKISKIFFANAATESVSVIRQDCTGYSSCYTSLSAWEAAQQRDLVASNEIATAMIEGTWTNPDATAVTIDGWTTGVDNYIKIYTTSEARHGGVWSDTKYRLDGVANYTYMLSVLEPYTKIDGLQIKRSGGGGTRNIVYINAANVDFSNGIVTKNTTAVSSGINVYSAASGTRVWNTLVYNVDEFGLQGSSLVYFYNNTIINSGAYGLKGASYSGTNINCKNNLVKGSASGDFFHTGSGTLSCSNSASGDGTSATYGATNKISQTFAFVDEGNNNYHLSSNDTAARDAGTDLSTDASLAFTTDSEGETRSGSWDIGADEYSSAGGVPAPDTTPPTRSGGSPSGALAAGTTQTNIILSTNESATCKYGSAANTLYASIANTFTATGGTSHSASISTQNGQSYTYYVRCTDGSGNDNTDDFTISFSVDNPAVADTNAPSIPTNLSATAVSSSQINLSWTASTDNIGVTGYTIFKNGAQLTTTTGTSYSNTGLTAATAYSYTISAYDAANNNSGQTASASATTQNQTTTVTTSSGAPTIFYTDIVSGPNTGGQNNKGVFVRVFGKNFGATRGTSAVTIGGGAADNYPTWSDTEISFQLGSSAQTGNIVVTTSNGASSGLPFAVRSGGIYFVDLNSPSNPGSGTFSDPWRSPNSFYNNAQPGDTMYMRAGTYAGQYGYQNWGAIFGMRAGTGNGFTRSGTQAMPIAYLAYPGETVTLSSPGPTGVTRAFRLVMNSAAEPAVDWVVVGNFKMVAYDACVAIGGNPGLYALGWRIVNNDCLGLIRTTQAQTGSIVPGGDYAKVLGNAIHGGRTANKLDHAVYSQACGDQIEIAWNHVYDNSFDSGPLISINYEGTRCTASGDGYAGDIFVHDNIIDATNYPCRGVYAYEQDWDDGDPVLPMTYVYNNLFINTGGPLNNGSLVVRNGGMEAYNNSFYGNNHTCLEFSGPTPNVDHIVFKNNICHMKSTATTYIGYPQDAPAVRDIRDNIYYGLGNYTGALDTNPINADPLYVNPGAGNLFLQSSSPAINKGFSITSALVAKDLLGTPRPQGSAFDIGAYEYVEGATITAPVTTPPPPPADTTPPTISSVQAATTTTSATITWTTDENASSQVEYGLTTSYGQSTAVNSTLTTSHSRSIIGLSPNTTYDYRVISRDAAGNSAIGQNRTFRTASVPDTTAPAAISNLTTSSAGQSSLTLTWSAPSDSSGMASYDLRYSTSPITGANFTSTTAFTALPTPRSAGFVEQYIAVELTPGTTYYFAIKSTDSIGNTSAISNIANATTVSAPSTTSATPSTVSGTVSTPNTTPASGGGASSGSTGGNITSYTVYQVIDNIAPTSPSETKINATDGQISLSWKNPLDSDFVRVKILRKSSGYSTSATDGIIVYGGKDTSFVDTGLTNGTAYYYTVYAYDSVPNYSVPVKLTAIPQGNTTQTSIVAEKNIVNTNTNTNTATNLPHPAGTLLRDIISKRTYYVDNGGVKRLIVSPTAFSANGFSWSKVVDVSGSVLGQYTDGSTVSGKIATTAVNAPVPSVPAAIAKVLGIPAAMKNALLVRVEGKIYAIVNNQKHAIASPSIFNAYKYTWSKVKNISPTQLSRYARVKLVKAIGQPAVYYLTDRGQKKVIPSANIFLAYSNKWSDIVELLPDDLAKYPDVKLIRLEGDTKIYLIENNAKRHVRSMDVFTRMKLRVDDVVTVKKIEFDAYGIGEDMK